MTAFPSDPDDQHSYPQSGPRRWKRTLPCGTKVPARTPSSPI